MSFSDHENNNQTNSVLNVLTSVLRQGKGTNWEVTKEVGMSLCEAMVAFDKVNDNQKFNSSVMTINVSYLYTWKTTFNLTSL